MLYIYKYIYIFMYIYIYIYIYIYHDYLYEANKRPINSRACKNCFPFKIGQQGQQKCNLQYKTSLILYLVLGDLPFFAILYVYATFPTISFFTSAIFLFLILH